MFLNALMHLFEGWNEPLNLFFLHLLCLVQKHHILLYFLVVKCHLILKLEHVYSVILDSLTDLRHFFLDAEPLIISG
jgi:hypothetical protein